jgi:hypothetical protein
MRVAVARDRSAGCAASTEKCGHSTDDDYSNQAMHIDILP